MKKLLLTLFFVVTFFGICSVSASAVVNDTVKVGLRYGSSALSAANLENAVGSGYALGYFDASRSFVSLGSTDQKAITMNAASGQYSIQLSNAYTSFSDAAQAAAACDGYPAYLNGVYYAQVGSYTSAAAAEAARTSLGISGTVVSTTSTAVRVTETSSGKSLFLFDYSGLMSLGVLPNGQGSASVTWFKGYRYYGGFEYQRITGGNLSVINVVSLEDYVKGVVPYEMNGTWPEAALEAQAVCARTFALATTKHLTSYGFDVCNSTDCQVYCGLNSATTASDSAVEDTAGQCLYYNGNLIQALYCSSDGGATEDAANVWEGAVGYLIGKADPYEATISIPNYSYSVTYTADQLTYILQAKGYSIGTVQNVSVSEFTNMGNVRRVTFTDTTGKTLTVKGDTCRTIFYSSTYSKSVRSLRYTINGAAAGGSGGYCVNDSSTVLNSLSGVSVISGSGTVSAYQGSSPYVITSSGTSALSSGSTAGTTVGTSSDFTISGTGYGHNVGMSQYGAYAMAQQGYSYQDILKFYYTNVSLG